MTLIYTITFIATMVAAYCFGVVHGRLQVEQEWDVKEGKGPQRW